MAGHSHQWRIVQRSENINPSTGRANPYVVEECTVQGCTETRQRGL